MSGASRAPDEYGGFGVNKGHWWSIVGCSLGPRYGLEIREGILRRDGGTHVRTPSVLPSLPFLFRAMIGSQETCPSWAALWCQAFPSLSRPSQPGHLVSKGLLLLGPFK